MFLQMIGLPADEVNEKRSKISNRQQYRVKSETRQGNSV